MNRPLLIALAAILWCAAFYTAVQAQEIEQPQVRVRLSQEHVQLLQQIIEQMTPERRQGLQELPSAQQQVLLLQLLQRAIAKQKPPIKEWLTEDSDKSVTFRSPEQYPDASERIENYVYKQSERQVEVVAIAFLRDGHDHNFNYKRLFRAKYKTKKDGQQYVADFLFQKKDSPYLEVKHWSRVPDEQG